MFFIDGIEQLIWRFKKAQLNIIAKFLGAIGANITDVNWHELFCAKIVVEQVRQIYFQFHRNLAISTVSYIKK